MADRTGGGDATALARLHEQIRVLHALRTEARLQPAFETGFVRFLRSLRERLHPRGVHDIQTVTLADSLTFQVDLGDRLGCDVFYGYVDEQFEADIFTEVLTPGATMIDVGANFGYYAVRCARAVGPTGAVYAFEPDPNAYQLLAANARANGVADWLHPQRAAVTDHDGEVAFSIADEAAFSSVAATGRSETREVVDVPARSLDAFAAEHDVARIDALKIDVEGHEGAVLRGAAHLLRSSPDPLIMLEVSAKNLSGAARTELAEALAGLFAAGFLGSVPDLASKSGLRVVSTASEAAGLTSANLFLVRPGGDTNRRLQDALSRRVGPSDGGTVTADAPRQDDGVAHSVRVFAGIDPALVRAALRDKVDAEERADALANEILRLGEQINLLRADRDALRAEVRRLARTPFGVVLRAARRIGRSVRPRQRPTS